MKTILLITGILLIAAPFVLLVLYARWNKNCEHMFWFAIEGRRCLKCGKLEQKGKP